MKNDESALYETKEEAVSLSGNDVNAWLKALEIAEKQQKEWLKKADDVCKLYVNEGKQKQKFNILYSNTQTIAPAVYNSQPLPDIRERYGEQEDGKYISRLLERAVSYNLDNYNFHSSIKDAVLDMLLTGRGVARIRYEPEMGKEVGLDGVPYDVVKYQKVSCDLVHWKDFIVGPARRWEEVPWVAFKHLMTREQLKKLAPDVADHIKLDSLVNEDSDKDVSEAPSLFKRALVYEIWDKEAQEVIFISPTYTDKSLSRSAPAINLGGFFPIPKPIYSVKRTDSLVPTIPYCLYEEQAKELDEITKRITALVKCLKWRGVYAKGFEAFGEIESADDGEFIPTESDFSMMAGMGLDKAVMFMPIDLLIGVVRELFVQREQVKQTIYEITGISDILRGSTKATETLGAQQLKAQWGSLRVSDVQEDIQRFSRDLISMMVEIMAENFEPNVLSSITGMEVNEQVISLLRNDTMRRYKIDIETDSTIRADLSRAQQNVSQFVQGFGSFIQSVGPAVQAGQMSREAVIELLLSFSRNFKLGRQAEAALESMKQQQGQGQQQPNQAQQADQRAAQEAQMKAQMEAQAEQQKIQFEKYKADLEAQNKLQIEKYKADLDAQTRIQIAQMQSIPKQVQVV